MVYSPIKKIPFGPYVCDVDLEHQILELSPLEQNFKIKIFYDKISLVSQEHILINWCSEKRYKFHLCLIAWDNTGHKRITYVPVY